MKDNCTLIIIIKSFSVSLHTRSKPVICVYFNIFLDTEYLVAYSVHYEILKFVMVVDGIIMEFVKEIELFNHLYLTLSDVSLQSLNFH